MVINLLLDKTGYILSSIFITVMVTGLWLFTGSEIMAVMTE